MDTEHRSAQAWTYIAEARHPLALALIDTSSYEIALEWVREYARTNTYPSDFSATIEQIGARESYVKQALDSWKIRLESYEELSQMAMDRMGIKFLIPEDPHWPEALNDLTDAPYGLWVRGMIDVLDQPALSFVGSRAATAYGQRLTRNLACDMSDSHVIVSGGAFGIDVSAHQAALNNGKPTLIVSAGGVDRPYPLSHADLYTNTVKNGVVVSESPVGAAPHRHRFLSRNRIIAALGAGTIVVEAPIRSGALSTARHAIDCGRPVGACPNSLDSLSSDGCHALIRDGATLIRNSADIRELISWEQLSLTDESGRDIFTMPADGYDPLQERVWECTPLSRAASAASIAKTAGVAEAQALRKLSLLALAGRVVHCANGWKRARMKK